MVIGINGGGHLQHYGGGAKEVIWHAVALRDLGHQVFILTSHGIHQRLMPKLHGFPIRAFRPGMEAQYDGFLTIDHFHVAQPLAKVWNAQRIMFPAINAKIPDGLRLYANSNYTAAHIRDRWNVDAETLYLPIENYYRQDPKEMAILHVSRFAEPNEFADKGHRQMIQAMRILQRALPGWRLILAGAVENGQNSYVDALLELSKGLPVEFMFDPTDEEIVGLFAKSAIYWHCTGVSLPMVPSAQEHFGITPLEAQASGCVPIVYRSGGMPEVVQDRRTGLLFDDVREMTQFTVEVANKLSLWAGYQQHGLIWARNWTDYLDFVRRVALMLEGKPINPMLPGYEPELKYRQEDVTIAIITLNRRDLLKKCIQSYKDTSPKAKILVLNNGEKIDYQESVYEGVEVVNFEENIGFARAYRHAESIIKTPLVFMSNDDVEATNGAWLHMLVLPMTDPTVGIVGPKLVFPDGRLQYATGGVDPRREDVGFHYHYGEPDSLDANVTRETDFTTGAGMLVRKELFHIADEVLDGYNFEDTWMCFSAREQGYKVIYQPASTLVHYEGQSKAERGEEMKALVEHNKQAFKARWTR